MKHKIMISIAILFFSIFSSTLRCRETCLNIYIHGMISIRPHLTMANFFRFLNDQIENTSYYETAKLMRQDTFFWKNNATGPLGLQRINCLPTVGNGSQIIAYLQENTRTTQKTEDHYYYTFGWSGLMSPRYREIAADKLYTALLKELQNYHTQGINPKIKIIGYSHGGGVALNLAKIKKPATIPFAELSIDQLILLGTPIPKNHHPLISDPIYKKIYHFYSHRDRIQRLDIFQTGRILSSHKFKSGNRHKLPKKLVQIRVKYTRKTKSNKKRKKDPTMNFCNRAIISGSSHLLRDISPGHFEWWFLSWPKTKHKKRFPFYPIPFVGIAPFIIEGIESIEHGCGADRTLTVDIRPDNNKMLLKLPHNKMVYLKDFIPQNKIHQLQKITQSFAPEHYTNRAQTQRMKFNFDQGFRTHMKKQKQLRLANQKFQQGNRFFGFGFR